VQKSIAGSSNGPKNIFFLPIKDAQLAEVEFDFPALLLKITRHRRNGLRRPDESRLAAASRFFHASANGRTSRFHLEQT
jgi:hypothetical protein